ncbi:hypothetical protein E1264_03375 [Actinomadura sp. KC216]|uniref:hypothetical protein n=1 Tax=Actinomadura sp. KC216 TaxID=2530370 RepID=UPI00104B64F5|nr:hypothetical protein [Actinomadura sp. KC216]TDB90880.1 hypothetical protein E1264_03375 [Actinomadura sp. KC216]
MRHWTTSDGSHVWAWEDVRGADYRAIWIPAKDSIELLRSVSAGAGWPTVATVSEVYDRFHAKHITDSWYALIFHIDTVK